MGPETDLKVLKEVLEVNISLCFWRHVLPEESAWLDRFSSVNLFDSSNLFSYSTARVRVEDRVGNDLADRAADFGRRRISDLVMDVRFLSACSPWYPVVLELHRFFIAIARAAVDEDLRPAVWSSGGLITRRRVRVSAWEYAWVPGPVGLWRHGSIGWPCIEVRDVDVGFWPYSVGLLVKLCSFLSSLHWPSTVGDLVVGGVSLVELLILYERWAGEGLVLEMSVPRLRRFDRPISVSAVPAGPSIDIWRSCRF